MDGGLHRELFSCGRDMTKFKPGTLIYSIEKHVGPVDKRTGIVIQHVNLREPYGQPHLGNPLELLEPEGIRLGMPFYNVFGVDVTYWDIHYVEVESVNLYANGNVSKTYPVSLGHDPAVGKVKDQGHFSVSGRQFDQWTNKKKLIAI